MVDRHGPGSPPGPLPPVCMLWSRLFHTNAGRDVILDILAPCDHSSGRGHTRGPGYTAWGRRAQRSPLAL